MQLLPGWRDTVIVSAFLGLCLLALATTELRFAVMFSDIDRMSSQHFQVPMTFKVVLSPLWRLFELKLIVFSAARLKFEAILA